MESIGMLNTYSFRTLADLLLSFSSFFQTANLTVRASFVPVGRAVLAGQQVDNTYIVNVNQTFDISVKPVDSVTRRQLVSVQWGNWTWEASATLYRLPTLNRPGALIPLRTSNTTINRQRTAVNLTGLQINAVGMYVLNVRLESTNNEHMFTLLSTAILVKYSDGQSYCSNSFFHCAIRFSR
jgi:hypothetical protein